LQYKGLKAYVIATVLQICLIKRSKILGTSADITFVMPQIRHTKLCQLLFALMHS